MQFVKTELANGSVNSGNHPEKVHCDTCGTPATLRAIFHYYNPSTGKGSSADDPKPQVVMVTNCPICGPQTQVRAWDSRVEC
jgi:endogenous inhibitor of DNA gyrase (YacG/DUF329 family)